MLQPIIPEILESLLQLGSERIFSPSTKESIIQLPPCSAKFGVYVELVNVDLSFGPLINALQLQEALCIVFHCLMGIELQGGSTSGAGQFNNRSDNLMIG